MNTQGTPNPKGDTMTVTLPAPLVRTPTGWGGKSRVREVTYLLPGTRVETATGTKQTAVQISVGHSKEAKQFYARVNQVTIGHGEFGTSTSFFPFDGVTLHRQPVARYSDKALDAFLEGVLDIFPDWVAGSAKVQAMFVPKAA